MRNVKFNIIRLANVNASFATGADILILKNWHATTLHIAVRLCELAAARFGGQWVPAVNGAETVTVYVGYTSGDFEKLPSRKAAPAPVSRRLARKVA